MTQRTVSRTEQRVRALIKVHRLQVLPVGSAGAVRIHGTGVDMTVCDLRYVSPLDLYPVQGPQRNDFDWTK